MVFTIWPENCRHLGIASGGTFCVRRELLLLLVSIVAIKAVLLVLDPYPALMFGDSASYLATAFNNWIPGDRSFVYGFILRALIVPAHSLRPVVYFQTALSALASWITAVCLIRYFGKPFAIAAVCSLLCAVEPLQLMFARFVLADSLATSGFALLLLLILEYFRRDKLACISDKSEAEPGAEIAYGANYMASQHALVPASLRTRLVAYLPGLPSLLLIAGIQVLSTVLASLRLSFVPVAIVTSIAVPVLSQRALSWLGLLVRKGRTAGAPLWRSAVPIIVVLVISVGLSQLCLFGYRCLYGHLAGKKPAYSYEDGCFYLAMVVPLVQPSDYPLPWQRRQIFQEVKFPLSAIEMRPAHHWMEGGLCDIIKRVVGRNDTANDVMRKTAIHAMKRDPIGVLKMAAYTYTDFFNYQDLVDTLKIEEGQGGGPAPQTAAWLQRSAHLNLSDRHFDSITKKWHAHALGWYWFLLVSPVLYVWYCLIRRRSIGVGHLICAMYALMFWLETFGLVERIATRYLITEAWLMFIMLGSVISWSYRSAN